MTDDGPTPAPRTDVPEAERSAPVEQAPTVENWPEIEHWFVHRGVPHFIERKVDGSMLDAWTRAVPLLVVAYLLRGFNALNIESWAVLRNVGVSAAVLVMLIAAWALSNRLRGVATFARPKYIEAPELALFLLGPAIPILVFGQFRDAIESIVIGVVLLIAIYMWSSYGVGPLIRWGARRSRGQLTGLGSLVARALPLLLLFNTFLFINAEVWEVAGTLYGIAYLIVIITFAALGATFAVSRVPGTIREVNSFESWDDIRDHLTGTPAEGIGLPTAAFQEDRLTLRQRFNIGLVVLFGQALQITLVAAALTGFFVLFGFFGITEATAAGWTRLDDVHVLTQMSLGGRDLVLTEPLVRVSLFLGAFSGMYFTVVLTTDDTYRTEFADDVGPEIREALAVRSAYRVARGTHPHSTADRTTGRTPGSTHDPHIDNGVA